MIDDYLEFKLIGNLWKIINKRGCFSFEQMVEGNNFNKWCFVPVSRCSGDWKKNINNDYTLNYNEVTPLKKVYTDDGGLEVRESVNYPPIELYMQSYDNGGLTVQVSSATPIVEIGNVAQDMAGVFIVNKVTNTVLAFCILPESFKVYNFISFLYDGYLLEINNPVMVDKPKLTEVVKSDTTLTINLDNDTYHSGDTITVNVLLNDSVGNKLDGKTVSDGTSIQTTNLNGIATFTYVADNTGIVEKTYVFEGDNWFNPSTKTITWNVVEEAVTPEIIISATNLIGGVGDDLPVTVQSNLKNTALTILLNDAEVADSVTTDNTGNASFNYNCNGAGDVNVKVKYLNGTNVYYSNILQVEDCVKYGFKASDTWINPTGHSATNTIVNGVFTSVSDSSKGDSILQLDITGDFIITYDAQWQASTRCGVGAKDTTRTQHFDSGTDSNFKTQKYIYWNGSKETETHYSESTQTTYCQCKIIKSDGHLKGYMNDTLVCDLSYPWISQCTVWNFHTTIWNSSTIKIKNLKIKSYST